MDFDNDGILDLISGSYDPGDIYLFRGLGAGEFAAGESLMDESGLPLVHHPVELARYLQNKDNPELSFDDTIEDCVASFGSWPELVDWDGDGDLDMLIGSFMGEVYLRMNVGDRTRPKFASESILVEAADGPIKVAGHAHPVVADWDHDGLWDLVVGSADGSVGWYRNIGSADAPKFGAYQVLIQAASENKFLEQQLMPGEMPRPGPRAQICVVDYNGDSLLDLLVGDYSDIKWKRELSPDEQQALGDNLAAMNQLAEQFAPLGYEGDEGQRRQALVEEYLKLREANKAFYLDSRSASFIWYYERKKPAAASADAVPLVNPNPGRSTTSSLRGATAPVSVSARIETDEDQPSIGSLVVTVEIREGWYLYADDDGGVGLPMRVSATLPKGCEFGGDWDKPPGILPADSKGGRIYKNQVVWTRPIMREVQLPAAGAMQLEVAFQACNDRLCLPPDKVTQLVDWPD